MTLCVTVLEKKPQKIYITMLEDTAFQQSLQNWTGTVILLHESLCNTEQKGPVPQVMLLTKQATYDQRSVTNH